MGYKKYTREEYLQWCKENVVKNPLPEYKRNKMTIDSSTTLKSKRWT